MKLVIDHYIKKNGDIIEETMTFPKFPRYQNIVNAVVNKCVFYGEGNLLEVIDNPGVKKFIIKLENPEFVFSHRKIEIEFKPYMGKNKCSTCTYYRECDGMKLCWVRKKVLDGDYWHHCQYYDLRFEYISVKVSRQ